MLKQANRRLKTCVGLRLPADPTDAACGAGAERLARRWHLKRQRLACGTAAGATGPSRGG